MLRTHAQFFRVVFLLTDLFCAGASFLLASYIHLQRSSEAGVRVALSPNHIHALPWVLLGCGVSFHIWMLYIPRRAGSRILEVRNILQACLCSTMFVAVLLSWDRDTRLSHFQIVVFFLLQVTLVGSNHLIVRSIMRKIRSLGLNLRHVLVIGAGRLGQEVLHSLRKESWMGYDVVGFCDDESTGEVQGCPVLGKIDEIDVVINSRGIDLVIVAMRQQDTDRIRDVIETLVVESVELNIVPDDYSFSALCMSADMLGSLPVIAVRQNPIHGINAVAKRMIDIVGALCALVIFSPVMLICVLGIKFTSRGPVFYIQRRTALGHRNFDMFKFRSMRTDAEGESGPVWAKRDDPRVTSWGSFMRKFNLDELPQLFNVVKGDMSLVGPRPERPELIEQFKDSIPRYMFRTSVKAGMTGWAQVNGWRGNTSLRKRIQYDIYYIENWSLWFDLEILFMQSLRPFDRNAY